MTKDDKLLPVITLVVYFGTKPRDGLLTVAQAAANAKLTEDQFRAEMLKAGF